MKILEKLNYSSLDVVLPEEELVECLKKLPEAMEMKNYAEVTKAKKGGICEAGRYKKVQGND